MRNFTILIFLTTVLLSQAQAQKISGGIKGGLNLTTWSGDAVETLQQALNDNTVLSLGSPRTGYHVGAFLSIPVASNFILEPGIYYSTKGAKVEETFFDNSLFRIKGVIENESKYLDIPILARVKLGKGFQLYAGPQVSYLLDNDISARAGILGLAYEQEFDYDPGFREVDFALSGGIGYQMENGVQLNAGYDHGLSTLDKGAGNIEAYNRAFKLSIGYTF